MIEEKDVTIAVAVSHTPWRDDRALTMHALRKQLGMADGGFAANEFFRAYKEFDQPEKVQEWSESMHRWLASTDASYCVCLQDDAVLAPNFFPALRALLTAYPHSIVGLEAVHPGGRMLARAGQHVYTTSDGLIGVGYVIPRKALLEKLRWQSESLHYGALESMTEDALVNVFALSTGRLILHPCPTILDHIVEMPSSYGNDDHPYRSPSVLWTDGDVCGWELADLERPEFWRNSPPVHMGRFYGGTIDLCKRWVRTSTADQRAVAMADSGPQMIRKWVPFFGRAGA